MKNVIKIFLLAGAIFMLSPAADAQVSVGLSVRLAPPPLPVYVQPECPVDGYLWQPGYWAYDPADGYYWVPGVWVAPPDPGLLWTPSYWGFDNGVYFYHRGYWGPHVGFYGGINYGFGYPGYGFYGGVWSGRSFRYNTAVFRVNRTVIHNTYINRVNVHPTASRASFNGRGGVVASPRADERRAMSEHHVAPTRMQESHQAMAGRNPAQRASANHGRPATPAMNRVGNHSVSSPNHVANSAEMHRGNPAANHNPGAMHNPGMNHNTPQINRSSPAQHMEHHNMPQQHMQPQHMEQQHMKPQHQMQPRPQMQPQHQMQQPRPMMQPQRAPMQQPHPMGGGGEPHMGGGGEPHGGGGGGHMGGGGGGGHRH